MSGDVEEWDNFVLSLLWVIEQKKCLFSTEVLTEIIKQIFSFYSFSFFQTEIRKLLSKISKEKGCEALAEWIKPCERHLHWSATSTFSGSGNGRIIWAKFKAFMSHVINRHTGLEDPLFNKCAHGDLQPRKWLTVGMLITLFICLW